MCWNILLAISNLSCLVLHCVSPWHQRVMEQFSTKKVYSAVLCSCIWPTTPTCRSFTFSPVQEESVASNRISKISDNWRQSLIAEAHTEAPGKSEWRMLSVTCARYKMSKSKSCNLRCGYGVETTQSDWPWAFRTGSYWLYVAAKYSVTRLHTAISFLPGIWKIFISNSFNK